MLALFASFFASCVGPRGPEGIPGRDGRDGQDGRDGNYNVLSIRYEVYASDWLASGTEGVPGYYLELEFDVPEITNDVAEDGVVLVYYRAQAGDPWILLPYTFISSDEPPFTEVLDFIYGPGFVNFKSQADDYGATPYEGTFRVIVADAIPIGKTAINYHDFEEVSAFLDLENAQEFYRRP
ncbi:MAG: hypothetical protein D6722_28785 [Bacteroidetes bacterium]|nr:MAG: hypothetical protein D6722_28785 [Bacteroidota bacterium]